MLGGSFSSRAKALLLALFFSSVMVLIACGEGAGRPAGTPLPPATPQDGVLTVGAFEWGFAPEAIVLTQGEEVRIVFENEGDVIHNFRIEELAAEGVESESTGSQSADEGELFVGANAADTGTLVFTPQESGTFDFYCTIRGHRSLGMEGTLIVR